VAADAHTEHVIDTRLVVIEGVMGSGKSTTGARIADVLRAVGADVVFVSEAAEPHPVRVMGALPDFRRPWDQPTVDEYRQASLKKWTRFVEAASASTTVHIFDGQLFHGDLTSMMLMDGSTNELTDHVLNITELARPLLPVLVHLWQADLRRSLQAVFDERGPRWERYQVGWKCASPYCFRRGLAGLDGLIAFYEAYQEIVGEIMALLPVRTIAIETTAGEWPLYEAKILGQLTTPAPPTDGS
jgi:hypothetical protein